MRLRDPQELSDLLTYLGRAERMEHASTRLAAAGGALAVYTAVLHPEGLLDATPTVLGLRVLPVDVDERFDEVVPIRPLTERLRLAVGADPIEVSLPAAAAGVPWAGVAPPRAGWAPVDAVDAARLLAAARAGAAEIAAAVPDAVGEHLVRRVRSEVWSRPMDGPERLPAGAAFAADYLGFLVEPDEAVPLFASGPWLRLSSARGHVLVRGRR